ncbi:MAG: preprotein translocase subunit SecG [Candidatus Omnitrophica bacterium 4484_70.1]|nr:MAG: preprotein translocase subunit SecG [Candidatus Omnitrophica bacterium 4484_70.1]
MYTLLLIFHIITVICLISIILVQRGRSGGLIEALGGVESIFGTKTSAFFTRLTVILAILFFLTSISLAYLSKQKCKSVIERISLDNQTSSVKQSSSNNAKSENK